MDEEIGPGRGRVLQKRKTHKRGLTAARRKRFLNALAGNCNVRRSAQLAKIPHSILYARRRTDPEFAGQWQEALAIGYARLEEAILAYSLRSVGASEVDEALEQGDGEPTGDAAVIAAAPAASISPEAIKLAMDVRARHRSEVQGEAFDKRGRKRATTTETDEALRRKLDALARKVKAQLGDG
ncbi:hypothetical protein ACLB0R_06080 [Sphingomonas sp. GlSt437]|uniref:hypothetical protein n=1 Tax=Sphingomonas sp. GlSt437 TaxID=3389970 RepID=UPI003A841663